KKCCWSLEREQEAGAAEENRAAAAGEAVGPGGDSPPAAQPKPSVPRNRVKGGGPITRSAAPRRRAV
ncbi:MAG: hypothetical protein FWD57_16850, partial [Polyangiaceae bacterium]|nr:hypothetical protein [Polyangiaceae bacterium]